VDASSSTEPLARQIGILYEKGTSAYWLPPLIVAAGGHPVGRIREGDSVIFCCRRGEREVQLTRAFVDDPFVGFQRTRLDPLTFVPLTLYHPDFATLPVAFSPQRIDHTLAEVVSSKGLSQLHIAEKEKYAHVTYFFNGGRTDPFPSEVDLSVPSFLDDPLKAPPLLTAKLGQALSDQAFSLVVVNIASGDLVGHYTDLESKIECAEAVDRALGDIMSIARTAGYWTAITADHGLLEEHCVLGGPINTSHTTHPVPFCLVAPSGEVVPVKHEGRLADVAPTILSLLHVETPREMTGNPLMEAADPEAQKVILVVLDGWGLGEEGHVNPIRQAHTPTWDGLRHNPMAELSASGEDVGLLPGHKGNSESGHMSIGAGRVVMQDDVRIAIAIENGSFVDNPAFGAALSNAREQQTALHLLGILSRTSSHGSVEYVLQLAQLACEQGLESVYIHLITDGRSTQPGRSPRLLREVGQEIARINAGMIVTLVGRGFALDRGEDYAGKTKMVYEALVEGTGTKLEVGGAT